MFLFFSSILSFIVILLRAICLELDLLIPGIATVAATERYRSAARNELKSGGKVCSQVFIKITASTATDDER